MKYNKEEQLAIDALYELAAGLKEQKKVTLELKQITAVQRVLGIDLHSITKNQTEVKKEYRFVRAKEELMFSYTYYGEHGWNERFCYFPFQIKKAPK
ncbi:conserved hypothetical protein [Vibrio crassostreae]|nr:conserved hypothetical protein [Vibrio crassostreae]